MRYRNQKIGLLQAGGLAAYIALFATAVHLVPERVNLPFLSPVLSMILFLMLFVISALISSSIILGYPLVLFSEGRRGEAMLIVIWSLIFLLAFLGFFMMTAISTGGV